MVRSMFGWYELRTTDVTAAQAFYADVLEVRGSQGLLYASDQPVASISPLPERAAARGAPAHWLGHVGVGDVDGAAQRMVAAGGELLGPVRRAPEGDLLAIVRDPLGAVLALSSKREPCSPAVAWHELHTREREQAWSLYAEIFGWHLTETLDLGLEAGPYQMFAWDAASPSVGAMLDSARLPGIHTHWLFYFSVGDLEAALARVRSRGGRIAQGPPSAPGSDRIAYIEDPQGAAFGLRETAARG